MSSRCMVWFCLALSAVLISSGPAQATILTFEVFDPGLNFDPYNDPLVPPALPGYGYIEGYRLPPAYGDYVSSSPVSPVSDPVDGVFRYGVGAELYTPQVSVDYGPYSIFTGGPELFRGGYGNLDGVLYQGSRYTPSSSIGTNYNILDIALYGDPGVDVKLFGFDLGAFGGSDLTINEVTVYNGFPFPFLTPTNHVFKQTNVDVEGDSPGRTTFDFSAAPYQSHVIWIRINANNLGDLSENIGIDNIRFG